MEDASDDHSLTTEMPVPVENGVILNDFENSKETDTSKLNGDTNSEESESEHSSDCATPATNTDSENNLKRKLVTSSPEDEIGSYKRFKCDSDFLPPTNPYFNESLFELSALHHSNSIDSNGEDEEVKNCINGTTKDVQDSSDNIKSNELSTKSKKVNNKKRKPITQKVQGSPQFLGLQPVIRFKCRKCSQSGFSSLLLLQEHLQRCTGEPAENQNTNNTSKKLLVTRRNVFLCSACGCYYENYNLFLHVYRVHRRFVCLYCSAVFSHTEKFLFHLLNKHNCVPKQLNSEKDFFDSHQQPCYLMCCDCEKIFGDEGDEHFYGHTCSVSKLRDSKNKFNNSNKVLVNNHKQINNKNKVKSKEFVEHVTGDTEAPTMTNSSEKDLQGSSESVMESQEHEEQVVEEAQPNLPSPVAIETENEPALVTTETVEKESEANLSSCEDTIDIITNSRENLNSDNENDVVLDGNITGSPSPDEVSEEQSGEEENKTEQQEEVRKVPKVTLKLRKRAPSTDQEHDEASEHEDTDDSDKLTMELDTNTMDCNNATSEDIDKGPTSCTDINIAGSDVPVTELELEQPLDKFDMQVLLQKCLQLTIPTCIYCNHARKISVNGKQLGLHAIAEHRFSAVVNSITAEELIPESFVMRIKEGLTELQDVYFSLETQTRDESVGFTHIFECFQCRYSTNVHKELYLHNRKMHAKSILLCIMCKSNFYSYSELTCHLCPGLYEQNSDLSYRCCICDTDNLPSAFRLMVHLRKRHNACDVCLELCHNQSRLSNHVWKHKLHHFCYRCGIAYRNKPDITKHLFWKHGTESVLCKKCLQKKWPHVYHFCMPPATFTCEECNLNFTKAVALKVHKRLHSNEKPHACSFENCTESFISKKLLLKHEFKHREPTEALDKDNVGKTDIHIDVDNASGLNENEKKESEIFVTDASKDEPKPKPKVDVLDLPALNLSESDSSDSEEESNSLRKPSTPSEPALIEKVGEDAIDGKIVNTAAQIYSVESPAPVLENIWDDFKNYQAQKEKPSTVENEDEKVDQMETVDASLPGTSNTTVALKDQKELVLAIMQDHDYSLLSQTYNHDPEPEPKLEEKPQRMDHDYCTQAKVTEEERPPTPEPPTTSKEEIKEAINSSSDSDSSCSCGPDCSCSSGSSSSSSDSSDSDSSTSEGRRKQQARREQRKQRTKVKKDSETSHVDVVATDANQTVVPSVELIIEETDLETTESETDEEFYDKQPQKIANKLLAEKRKELMMLADLGPLVNGTIMESSRPSTPSLPETEVVKLKPKKSKSKKKKRKSKKRERNNSDAPSNIYQYPTVSPLSISLPKNSPMSVSTPSLMTPPILSTLATDFNSDSNMSDSLRASKRRRIPNKFYGYSSDEEQEKHEKLEKHQPPVLKWRKADLPSPAPPPLLVPPITLKAIPPPPVEQDPVPVQPSFHHPHPALFKPKVHDATESNESTSEDEQAMPTMNKPLNQPPLYCYCRCPYDEVSEMIGCDADDCLIEWFHFECVGIMVPPKGQWYCPDCRKKRQQRRELSQL